MLPVVVVCVVFFSLPAHAWLCEGHLAVAELSRRHLKPNVAKTMETIAADLRSTGPFPEIGDFVQTACWADSLKAYGLDVMKEWHYVDKPYEQKNNTDSADENAGGNVINVIKGLTRTLTQKKLRPYVVNFAVANLVHLYGDIHQPLHAISRISPNHPNGDNGGNEKVYYKGRLMLLHFVWDSICRGEEDRMHLPLNKATYTKLRGFVDHLEKTHNFTDKEKLETDPVVMANESYTAAVEVAYPDIGDFATLSDMYIANCTAVAERRLALAGYRLATLLNTLFKNISIPTRAQSNCSCSAQKASCPCRRKKHYLHAYDFSNGH